MKGKPKRLWKGGTADMSYNTNHYDARADEDIVDVLTAISVVSKRRASNLTAARQQSKSRKGGKAHEQYGNLFHNQNCN